MRRRTTKMLTGIAVIFITLGMIYVIATAISATRLRKAYIALEKDGRPMEMASVIPPEIRALGRIVGAKALLQAREGQIDEAWRTVLVQLTCADALRTEPILVSQLIRTAQISEACTAIQELCGLSLPSERQTLDLQGLLSRYDDVGPLIRALDGERLIFGEQTFRLPKDELRMVLGNTQSDGNVLGITSWLTFLWMSSKPVLLADRAAYLRWMLDCTRQFAAPFDPNEAETFDERYSETDKHHALTEILIPAMGRVKVIYLDTIADIRTTKVGLALLRHRITDGSLPETPDALETENIGDPFSGGNLGYRLRCMGFELYSVGPDQKDNGGAAKQAEQKTDYDIVWRFSGQ